MKKRILSFFLALLLLPAAGMAEVATQLMGYLLPDNGVQQVDISIALNTFAPYGEQFVASVNDLLSAVTLSCAFGTQGEMEVLNAQLNVGEDTVFSLAQSQWQGVCRQATNLLPGQVLSGGGNNLSSLLGSDVSDTVWEKQLALPDGLEELKTGLLAFYESAEKIAKTKKENKRITGVGLANTQTTYTLPAEEQEELKWQLVDTLLSFLPEDWQEMCRPESITNKWTIVHYQYDETDMGLSIEGSQTMADGEKRKISMVLGWYTEDGITNTVLTADTTTTTTNKLSFSLKMSQSQTDSSEKYSLSSTTEGTYDKVPFKETASVSLVNAIADTNQRLTGEITFSTLQNERTTAWSLKPTALVSYYGSDAQDARGTVRITKTISGDEMLSLVLSFTGSSLEEAQVPEGTDEIFDNMTEENKQVLAARAAENFTILLVKALAKLPRENLTLLNDYLGENGLTTLLGQ